jgi:hypothetical protein
MGPPVRPCTGGRLPHRDHHRARSCPVHILIADTDEPKAKRHCIIWLNCACCNTTKLIAQEGRRFAVSLTNCLVHRRLVSYMMYVSSTNGRCWCQPGGSEEGVTDGMVTRVDHIGTLARSRPAGASTEKKQAA